MIIRGACNTKEQQRLIKDSPNLKDIITDIVDKETLDAIKNSASKSFDLFDMPDCKKGLQDQYIQDAFCSIKIKNLGLDSEWQFAKNANFLQFAAFDSCFHMAKYQCLYTG